MNFDLDLFAEVADEPLMFEELPDGAALGVATLVCSATQFCATECLGTAATLVCGPCAMSFAG